MEVAERNGEAAEHNRTQKKNEHLRTIYRADLVKERERDENP